MENKQMTIYEIIASEGWKAFSKKLEIIASIVFFAALLMSFSNIRGFRVMLTLGGSTLMVIYFFEAYKQFPYSSKLWSFLFFKIHGFGLSFSWVFILFTIEHWTYIKTPYFFVSLIALLTSLVLGLRVKNQEKHPEITMLYFIRLLVTLGLVVFVYLRYIL